MRRKMKNDYFSILSQNCIGGVFYHDMGLKFTTPTVNLYFTCPDFVKFVLNLDYYLNKDIEMTWGEEYPIGYIDDIRVYFQHYKSCTEAKKKWEERKGRINKENLVILCTDMETFDDETYSRWKKIPYPKLLFTSLPLSDQDVLYFPQYRENGHIGDLIPKREFYKDKRLIDVVNRVG